MFIPTLNKKKKIAVSTMIGYILLITFSIIIAGVVYQWLKTYVPKDGVACPDGVSVYISNSAYDNAKNELKLTLKNNGQFSVGGIYIYYSTSETEEIATNDLSEKIASGGSRLNPGISVGIIGENSFEPGGEDKVLVFDMSGLAEQKIYAVEITPIRWQEEKNKKQIVNCANAKTKKILDLTISNLPEEESKISSFSEKTPGLSQESSQIE